MSDYIIQILWVGLLVHAQNRACGFRQFRQSVIGVVPVMQPGSLEITSNNNMFMAWCNWDLTLRHTEICPCFTPSSISAFSVWLTDNDNRNRWLCKTIKTESCPSVILSSLATIRSQYVTIWVIIFNSVWPSDPIYRLIDSEVQWQSPESKR